MGTGTLNRVPGTSAAPAIGQRRTVVLLAGFVLLGLAIALVAGYFAGSSDSGLLIAAVGILLAPPLIALVVMAGADLMPMARVLSANWTWWHPLWLLTFASMLVFRIREGSAATANPLDANALMRIACEGFVAFSLIVRLVLRKPFWLGSLFRGLVGALGLYCVASIISTAWSVNPPWTAYKSFEFLVDVSLLASIVASAESWLDFKKLFDWTVTFYGAALVVVWINVPIFPTDAWDGGRLTGVIPVEASNAVGAEGAVLALVALCRLIPMFGRAKNRAWYLFLFLFGLTSMVLSQTRNAEAAFVIGVLLIAAFSPPMRKLVLRVTAVVAPIIAVSVYFNQWMWHKATEVAISFFAREQSTDAVESLSGRLGWWTYGLHLLSQHPFTGIGAYGGRFAVLDKLGVGSAAMMHSDWIEVVIGTSFWGLIPFTAALLGAWWYLIRCVRGSKFTEEQRQLALEMIALLAMLTLHSFFNDEMSWHAPLLYFSIVAYAEFARRRNKYDPDSMMGSNRYL